MGVSKVGPFAREPCAASSEATVHADFGSQKTEELCAMQAVVVCSYRYV